MIPADVRYMQAALALAARTQGQTSPNPAVGCVLVRDGRVVGRGWTAPGGRPHAETQALARAGEAARGATAYVTLEPCAHHGQTPPCADALMAAGVARVVIAYPDPDPRVNGAGVARLLAAGIAVEEGLLRDEAAALMAGYLSRRARRRPLVTLKLASSLDGRIATATGESRWITGRPARREGHAMRGRHEAVMVGIGSLLTDDSLLTCRLPGFCARQPVRIVADSHLRTPLDSRAVQSVGEAPLWLLHREEEDEARRVALAAAGVRCIGVSGGAGGVSLAAGFAVLAEAGISSVLVEGGGQMAAALLRGGLVDRIAWFHAPMAMGGDAWAAVAAMGVGSLEAAPCFRRVEMRVVGEDVLSVLEVAGAGMRG